MAFVNYGSLVCHVLGLWLSGELQILQSTPTPVLSR